ncbi:MAG: glycoside hydrolase family 5 protein [Oscillospiraceae bacterium]|nr:glycoside hydrolase family 5 protein [Oscillospiraceae bacterium]
MGKKGVLILFSTLFLTLALVPSCPPATTGEDGNNISETMANQSIDVSDEPKTEEDIVDISPPAEIPFPGYTPSENEMRIISSKELIKEITLGWNLGNTFDSLRGETSWHNPLTTFTMIQTIADAGFDSVRLPVTWREYLGDAPDYVIDGEFLDRVEEVVGYILATGMYCIINTHHEGYEPYETKEDEISGKMTAIWSQLSARFADYNEKLIFEGMNEPRWYGTPHEWDGGTKEAHDTVNRLNAVFIDAVRATGGNNENRHLMIPTYAASAEASAVMAISKAFSDITRGDNKVIVSIHAYTPTNFALDPRGGKTWLSERHEEEISWMFGRLNEHLVKNDIPVIMGECGAVNKDNSEDRIEWAKCYFKKARDLGIPAFWWDNGIFTARNEDSELFGFFDRERATFVFPEILEAMMNN